MSGVDWAVNLGGLVLIALIVWWFWLSRPTQSRQAGAGQVIEVVVADGVYDPPRIEVPAGAPVTLRFLRKDPSPCAEKVIFEGLGVGADLPVGKWVEVTVRPERPGEYAFTCQMQMYRGVLVAGQPVASAA